MKGAVSIITILVVGMIFIVTLIGVIMIPVIFLKYHLVEDVQIKMGYSNSELLLMTLLSVNNDDYVVHDELINYFVFDDDSGLEFLDNSMETIMNEMDEDCFELISGDEVLVSSDCSADKFKSEAKIALPYNPDKLTQEIELVIE